ncbi:non-ribosomal peptide synthetase [Streptomyces melanogenes]|uniref:non-ribosomal peptide synthetase n=1 Tax=Streptomyces melanogenes TaxID=67326 RepID=UPI00167C6952|nr:non-ribosomal peptide synthetase [Streptomyces melanogenes]GGP85762.1 amino acid adenylation protein [Streptomyces melanogenes]
MTVAAERQPAAGHSTLLDLFETAARDWPGALALDLPPAEGRPRRSLTYAELKARADELAAAVAAVVEPGGIAAVLLPRTTERLYAAQLGVLRAGAAHVCLDPAFPDAQLHAVLAGSGAAAVLTDLKGELRLFAAGYEGPVIRVDRPLEPAPGTLPAPVDPDALAYLIYTSGTTGRPKGVMIAHRSIASLIASDVAEFALGPGDRVAQSSSSAYDSSVEETWMALASGATVVVLDDEAVRLGPDLVPWLRRERVTVLCPPPTLLRSAGCDDPGTELPELRLLYVGGEALPPDVADAWSTGRRMVNGYGPTECTVTCVRHDVVPGERIAIGRPVPGMRAWVLDRNLEPVPRGERGELCMSGSGLALGYLGAPERTDESFLPHPRLGRIYRTGDLVHQEPDGTLVCHGRIDSQVKLRGYRIELEAVEAALARCPGVREAACRVQGEGAAQLLAAHIVPADASRPPESGVLAGLLREALPSYMVPARFGALDELPRDAGGKVRRAELPLLEPPEPGGDRALLGPEPADVAVVRIALAVGQVLDLPHVAADADFFTDLGGTSLHAATLISRLRADPATASLAVRDVYEARTVEKLARRVRRPGHPSTALPPEPDPGGAAAAGGDDAVVATVEQAAWLTAELVALSVPAYLLAFWLLPWLSDAVGLVPLLLLGPLAAAPVRLLLAPLTVRIAVFAKKALVGTYIVETVPVWSERAVRMWIVRQVVRIVPWGSLAGTEYQCMALRALGARIGERVHIHRGVNLQRGGWDLLDVGDDVTLSQDASVGLMHLEAGQIVVGPVVLGDGATLDVRAGVGPDTRVGRGAWLTALSSLPRHTEVPDGELADGVPARVGGWVPPPPPLTRLDRELAPKAHGVALMLSQALLRGVLAAPYGLLAALLAGGLGLDYDALLAAPTHPAQHPVLLAGIAALTCLGLAASVALAALAARALGTVEPGVISRWSPAYIRVWLKASLVDSAGNWLSGTLLWPRWLRAAGMDIGPDCEISTIIDVVPELVSIGGGSFLADGIYLGGPRIHRGTVALGLLGLGSGTFVGNHAVLPCGASLPDDLLIGIATPGHDRAFRPGSAWFGHPVFELPRREVVEADRALTHEPTPLRRFNRWLWELARFLLPLVPLAATEAWLQGADALGPTRSSPWPLLAVPAVTLGCALALCAVVLALKWILLGRVRPASHPLWSCWCSRWDFLYVAWGVIATAPLTALEGTLLLPLYLRLTGMRIGRRVVLGEGFAQVVDPDMLDIADGATVAANFQAHTFEDRVLKIDHVRVGEGATLGENSVVLYGADIGAHTVVAPHSVVMKRESLLPGRRYEGVPTRPAVPR